MDSYSVNEAAAVLGIPEGRVWELLARGVLAGSTEVGGDMRVVLRGASLPDAAKSAAPNGFRSDTNGGTGNGENGGGHGEMTPFRELLTEFRNLTERYGQALLALGESRGEVAALRGRVDLLEARIEHRLPWTEAPPAGWNAEALPEPDAAELEAAESEAAESEDADPAADDLSSMDAQPPDDVLDPAPDELMSETELSEDEMTEDAMTNTGRADEAPNDDLTGDQAKPHRTSSRSRSREAVSGFAEALARAEDPTTAEVGDGEEPLPGADDIADAMAAYRDEIAADAAPVVRAGYSTATPEPDWIAEEDLVVIAAPIEDDAPKAARQAKEPEALVDEAVAAEEVLAEEVETEPEARPLDPPNVLMAGALPAEPAEAERPESQLAEAAEDEPPAAVDSDYPWPEEEPEAEPEAEPAPRIAAIAIGEPDKPPAVTEAVAAEQPQVRTPIEIAAEPPAPDDVALLIGPAAFSEPPQIPREPAFWEAGARARAPFAVPHMDAWEASASEAMRVATGPEVSAEPSAALPTPRQMSPTTAPTAPPSETAWPDTAWPEVEVGWGSASAASSPTSSQPSSSEPSTADAAPAPARPRPAARRKRGPAARAIRRLRILLD